MQKCTQCKKYTDSLEIFSKGECLKCHEQNYNERKAHITGKDVQYSFIKAVI